MVFAEWRTLKYVLVTHAGLQLAGNSWLPAGWTQSSWRKGRLENLLTSCYPRQLPEAPPLRQRMANWICRLPSRAAFSHPLFLSGASQTMSGGGIEGPLGPVRDCCSTRDSRLGRL